MSRETRHDPMPCPVCGYMVDCMGALDHDNKPDDGDLTICVKCAHVSRICCEDGKFTLRVAEREDFEGISNESLRRMKQVQIAIQLIQAEKN